MTEGGRSSTAEHLTARDARGRVLVIEKLGVAATENAIGGLEWKGLGPAYRLQGGGDVQRIDESTFRIVKTGEVVRREEGQHGITHHTRHQPLVQP
jgi:hypothetical protein